MPPLVSAFRSEAGRLVVVAFLVVTAMPCGAFHPQPAASFGMFKTLHRRLALQGLCMSADSESETSNEAGTKGDNKAMQFLKKIGRIGHKRDFTYALGVDEGSVGKASMSSTSLRKSKGAYPTVADSGIVDELKEAFPLSALGTSWSGYTDQVMGGASTGLLERNDDFYGRKANVLRGKVRLLPGSPDRAGFVQMATNLCLENAASDAPQTADASAYDGVELDLCYEGDNPAYNVHLKTPVCQTPMASYRATFEMSKGAGVWQTVRVPWSQFAGKGAGAEDSPLDPSSLVRTGIVAIGKEMPSLALGISGFRFYKSD